MGICLSVRLNNGSFFRLVFGIVAQLCLVHEKFGRTRLAGGHSHVERFWAVRYLRQRSGVVPGCICGGLRQVTRREASESICESDRRQSAQGRLFCAHWPPDPIGGQVMDVARYSDCAERVQNCEDDPLGHEGSNLATFAGQLPAPRRELYGSFFGFFDRSLRRTSHEEMKRSRGVHAD